MDSLKAHRKVKVARKVREWLNFEWKRLEKKTFHTEGTLPFLGGPFTVKMMKVYDPRIPYQDNSWDCGVFVCRYAFALYHQRENHITYKEIEDDPQFQRSITRSLGFQFDMKDIVRLRREIKTLIDRLSELYETAKMFEGSDNGTQSIESSPKLLEH